MCPETSDGATLLDSAGMLEKRLANLSAKPLCLQTSADSSPTPNLARPNGSKDLNGRLLLDLYTE